MVGLRITISCLITVLWLASPAHSGERNLLRNGSFEGGTRYWYEAEGRALVRGDAAFGEYALRIDAGGIQSAAFTLEPAKPVTISFSARADADTTIGWQCTPCAREIGIKAGLTWGMKSHHPVKLTTGWQRYSFHFTPTLPQDGFWPRPTYMLQFGDGDKPWFLDGVTVAYDAGADTYIARSDVEVQATCPDLKGYRDATGNLLDKGTTVTLFAHASNPTKRERDVTLRWQLVDYEGNRTFGDAIDHRVRLPAGKVTSESVPMKLTATGMVLGRVSAFDADGKVLDSSDIPLCSLPYPSAATKPDWRERFGGSLFGPHNANLCARMGFAWTRWRPHMNWADHQLRQQDPPEAWTWFDKVLDEQEKKGISTHAVLYGKPAWAFANDHEQLPFDMQWVPSSPRWDDLTAQCAWDRFVIAAVHHYKGRSIVYEIENEPEFDGWDDKKEQYARFTLRTARLIKQADPQARVMVDNVYAIPSGLNRYLLEKAKAAGATKLIDIISWHDYHEGWLADGAAISRMRAALDELDCAHVQIWFNEGWAYTNTIVDEPAVALTHLDAAQSTNAMIDSVAELTVNGQEKTILFHTGYEEHGMSFWDYAGPGTMLWDYYGYPLPLAPAWNTLVHHIGLSERVGFVRPEYANLCIFQDLRNGRGVIVAYADRVAKADVSVSLPLPGLSAEDAMGNSVDLSGQHVILSKTGRPVFLYGADKTSGQSLLEQFKPLDRVNTTLVNVTASGTIWKLPGEWKGSGLDHAAGNPVLADNVPVWQLDQLWPVKPEKPDSYRRLVWHDGWWIAPDHGAGGQPKAEMKDSGLRMEFRAAQNDSPGEKLCGLAFIAPKTASYRISGTAELKLWDGKNPVRLSFLHKGQDGATELATLPLKADVRVSFPLMSVQVSAGDQLVLMPRIEGMFTGGDVTLRDVQVSLAAAGLHDENARP